MKAMNVLVGCCAVVASLVASDASAGVGKIKAKWFEADISPEVGALLAGYGPNDVSVAKHDSLVASGLCLDDGTNRVMLLSLDLIGLDYDSIKDLRRRLSAITGAPEEGILITCTHTHQGPHTRMFHRKQALTGEKVFNEDPNSLDSLYMKTLYERLEAAARKMMEGKWGQYVVGFHSGQCDENRNRRYTTEDNHATFNAHRPILHKLTTGIADHEVGTLVLLGGPTGVAYVVGNWAAHALTAHSPGLGGRRISADFPGFYRRYIENETGAKAMFVQGAAGDLVTKDDECGLAAAKRVGEAVATQSILGIISMSRCFDRFAIQSPRVGGVIKPFTSRLRKKWRDFYKCDTATFDVQVVAVGDVCFVGLPGEVVCELGLEIKWNSPFARTFIAYLATGYTGYVTPMNLMAAGGYEAQSHRFASADTLTMVKTAQDAMLELRRRIFPDADTDEDPYPDNQHPPIVNMPGMYKEYKWSR